MEEAAPMPVEEDTSFEFGANVQPDEKTLKKRAWWQEYKHTVWARVQDAREALIKQMGGKCEQCGEIEKLHFHHPKGRDWEPNKKNRAQRIRLYIRDYIAGNLELLCESCNCSDNGHRCGVRKYKRRCKNCK